MMTRNPKTTGIAFVVGALGLIVVGCDSSGSAGPETPAEATPTITVFDGSDPARVEINAPKGHRGPFMVRSVSQAGEVITETTFDPANPTANLPFATRQIVNDPGLAEVIRELRQQGLTVP